MEDLALNALDKTNPFCYFAVSKPKKDQQKHNNVGSEKQEHYTIIESLSECCLSCAHIVFDLCATHCALGLSQNWQHKNRKRKSNPSHDAQK